MTYVLGLTGSIGMGKSTTAAMFAEYGVPVWDADASVSRLYSVGGAAALVLAEILPDAIENGAVSKDRLRELIAADPAVLDRVQAIVHPMVAADRRAFLDAATADVVLLDIPLLFETGADAICDAVVVVSVPPEVQRARVLDRGTMTPAQFDMILSRQMPDTEKRARAKWVIETLSLDSAHEAVKQVLADIRKDRADALA